jgi:hypothetical protein
MAMRACCGRSAGSIRGGRAAWTFTAVEPADATDDRCPKGNDAPAHATRVAPSTAQSVRFTGCSPVACAEGNGADRPALEQVRTSLLARYFEKVMVRLFEAGFRLMVLCFAETQLAPAFVQESWKFA